MCNRKQQNKFVNDSSLARLEITCQPEKVTYRDEGGNTNYLFVYFVLRPGAAGYPEAVMQNRKLAVEISAEYQNGTTIIRDKKGSPLKILGQAGRAQFKPNTYTGVEESNIFLDTSKKHGSVRYKLQVLSSNHQSQPFRLKIKLRDVAENIVQPAYTEPTTVLSKRKFLRKEHRTVEIDQRRSVEIEAAGQNETLAKFLPSSMEDNDMSIRELAKLAMTTKYPDPNADDTSFPGTFIVPTFSKRKKSKVINNASRLRSPSDETEIVTEDVPDLGSPFKRRKVQTNPEKNHCYDYSNSNNIVQEELPYSALLKLVFNLQKEVGMLNARVKDQEKQLAQMRDINVPLSQRSLDLDPFASWHSNSAELSRNHSLAIDPAPEQYPARQGGVIVERSISLILSNNK
jgi:hypothetical protein